MCGFCEIENSAPINIFSDDEIERIVIGVYSGLITPQSLDVATYLRVGEKLTNGVYNGFGKSLTNVEWNSPDYKMLSDLRNNVYVFSGAKQYHQVREMVDAIYDKDRIKPFSEYKQTGTEIFKNYNENYLRAEYNAAISQSRSASMWMEIEANSELLPMLTYQTVGDGRVRPEHAMLDEISRPVGDKFWNYAFPPNSWNCRCTVIQTDSENKSSLKGVNILKDIPPEFRMNSGKDRIIFSDKHPYFTVEPKDKTLADNNFYLPKPKQVIGKLPEPVKVNEFVPAKDIKEAEERILQLGVKTVDLSGYTKEHYNGILNALENVPKQAIPTIITDKKGYESISNLKIKRGAKEWMGLAQKMEIFDKKTLSYNYEKIIVINSNGFKTLESMSVKKIEYNKFYSGIKNGNKWYFNDFNGSTHYHELGHIYDSNISTKKEWIEISDKWHKETKIDLLKPSKGGDFRGENGSEAFAEAFASYFGNKKQGLPNYVIDFFDKNIK